MQSLQSDFEKLCATIAAFEAKEIFDKNNFTDEDAAALEYLRDLNRIYEVLSPRELDSPKTACIFDCFPGVMPSKYAFAYKNKAYFNLENALIALFLQENVTEVWIDMSQGFAIAAANAVIRMKKHGFNMMLNLAIPYKGHGDQIFGASKSMYDYIKKNADLTVQVSDLPKNKESFKNGIKYMTDKSNIMIMCETKSQNNDYYLKYCKENNVDVVKFDLETLKRID